MQTPEACHILLRIEIFTYFYVAIDMIDKVMLDCTMFGALLWVWQVEKDID